MTTAHQRRLTGRKLLGILLLAVLLCAVARAQMPPVLKPSAKKASALPPKIASASKAMKKSVVVSQRKIVLSWNQYTNIYFQVEATTNLCDWYQVTNIFPKWPTNCALPMNRPAEFFRIQTKNQ